MIIKLPYGLVKSMVSINLYIVVTTIVLASILYILDAFLQSKEMHKKISTILKALAVCLTVLFIIELISVILARS